MRSRCARRDEDRVDTDILSESQRGKGSAHSGSGDASLDLNLENWPGAG